MSFFFDEAIGTSDNSTGNGGFSLGGGKYTRLYRVQALDVDDTTVIPFTADQVRNVIPLIVGSTSVAVGDGRMQRTPPLADPCFTWMIASAINKFEGRGQFTFEEAEAELEVAAVPQWNLYPQYDIGIEFTPQKYPLTADEDLPPQTGSWWPDVNTDSTSSQQTFTWAQETARYTTEPVITDANEFVTAQQGSMKFKTNSTNYGGQNPNGKVFPGKLKMLYPNMRMSITTYAMPLRYLTSARSYITGGSTRAPWTGRINQNALTWAGMYFPIGSLQYLNYAYEMYTQNVPREAAFIAGVSSSQKLMNLTLNFSYTLRTAKDNTSPNANKNYIQAPHNYQPWPVTRKFHYCETAAGFPSWPSAPFELFHTDPDLVQTVG